MTSAAVFDLDNTIVRGSSLFLFGKFLVRRRVLSARHVIRFVGAQYRYKRGAGENTGAADTATQLALGLIAGVPQTTMSAYVDQFVRDLSARHLEPGMLAELRRQHSRGVPCFIATASPQELADAFARRLGMAGGFGTVAEVSNDVYTGRLVGPLCHGNAKVRRVRNGLAERGLDISRAVVFTDSVNDLPMLAEAGRPVAVNPDPELLVIAERNGWPVIPGRRDEARTTQGLLAYLPFPM